MLDNDSATAKTVNGFRTGLERERAKKTGLFLDWRLLDLEAATRFPSGQAASILQVLRSSRTNRNLRCDVRCTWTEMKWSSRSEVLNKSSCCSMETFTANELTRAVAAEKLEGTSDGVDTDDRSPWSFPPYPFAVSRYCPTPVSPIYFPTFLSVSPLNSACRSAQQKITKIAKKSRSGPNTLY